ncbi:MULTISPECIES: M15 family metallopeptidase [Robertmurraya]|jgi:D-alanyl-D-alanine carboxypeptidase|uniref:D-alanyl-D-alanine carboxypeptidase family protein n=1 Tax=Robertmurraya beringensis TaxID=641660 RepID=A0ABV6KY73_9BACI|nr:D-alanyl-D-alanine carboxypeptidase [Mycobacteroides abscessus subsp. abscessus]
MRKYLLSIAGITLLLSGCDFSKIPYLNNNQKEETTQTDEQKDNEPIVDQENNGQNDSTEGAAGDSTQDQDSLPEGPTLEAIFFNDVKEVDGKQVIQNPLNVLALVNKMFALPESYNPTDLVKPNVSFSFGDQTIEKSLMRQEAAVALENMFAEAKTSGIELYAVSGYRSYERQRIIFDAEVKKSGEEKAMQVVAVPGNSEHQSGLAMDISAKSANLSLTESFGETNEGKWLAANAHKYGFILRYPKGKETITGYQYEPWHFRYVGVDAAQTIFEKNITLEEYFDIVEKI